MSFEKIAELGSHVTVQQMIARDMFQDRIKAEKPIFVSEFLYPLMQGYDSVALDIDGEIGGNDQTFNMLVGRDLLKIYRQKDKLVLPVRLLVDPTTGRKIGKSEGGFIALRDAPEIIFEKVTRTIPNEAIKNVFILCTEVSESDIETMHERAKETGEWRAFNLSLAEELVRMYHGEKAVRPAREAYERSVTGSVTEDDEAVLVKGTAHTSMAHILATALSVSKSEAKRLIEQRAVTKNGELVTDPLGPSGAQDGDVLRVGSHRPFRIQLTS
jgi:tyrosyl-tRNA synthetase